MDDSVRLAGREAARHGVPLSACPFMKAPNMSGHAGAPPQHWNAKLTAWETGWREETEVRLAELKRRKLLRDSD
ncbi:CrpP-related protein [Achromobacter insolitus]|uniref:CrpP-related protein n=1 Tax=Achromobacter insolitus TaxID=217204 RepID=UPI003B997D66